MPPNHTLVISHAACAGHAPENTLAGVRAALAIGADAIEIDVQPSADGVPVLMHDLTVDRTTNGSGDLAALTLAQLQALDAGGAPVPTFAEVLALTKGRALLVAPQSIANWPAMRELALRIGLQAVSVYHQSLDETIVAQARRAALAVYAWTADAETDIDRLLALGVDGIVSNRPERVLAALGRPAGAP